MTSDGCWIQLPTMSDESTETNDGIDRRGLILVLSSPSGAGKTTLSRLLLERDSNIVMSVSATTRTPRPGEVDGKDYLFVSRDDFGMMKNRREFLEDAKVFDHYYGTPRKPVDEALGVGKDVLCDVDWQGAQQMTQIAQEDLVSIFILPPSNAELERRLNTRAQDTPEVVSRRMAGASDEISRWSEYDYIIINDDVETSLEKIHAILKAERLKRVRQIGLIDFVKRLQEGH